VVKYVRKSETVAVFHYLETQGEVDDDRLPE